MGVVNVGKAVTEQGVIEGAQIVFEGDRIVDIRAGQHSDDGLWAVPGFVDTHCHGAVGAAFGDPDLDANRRARRFHLEQGSTTLFASTVTLAIEDLEEQSRLLRGLHDDGVLDGIHLEGPFLAPEKKGAHPLALLRDPVPEAVERLIAAGGDALKMVTLAPEWPHGLDATRRFTEADVAVAFGHSNADANTTRACIDAGATVATHLFNAMNGIHHREPGPVPALMEDERVLLELICDGVHLDPDIVRMAHQAAGPGRIALVTDAMAATGSPDGEYMLGTLGVVVKNSVARLATNDGSEGAIAGSTLTMANAFKFCVQQVGLPIPDVARMAATTPARYHGLDDVGVLAVGKRADLCVVDSSGKLQQVWQKGVQIV